MIAAGANGNIARHDRGPRNPDTDGRATRPDR